MKTTICTLLSGLLVVAGTASCDRKDEASSAAVEAAEEQTTPSPPEEDEAVAEQATDESLVEQADTTQAKEQPFEPLEGWTIVESVEQLSEEDRAAFDRMSQARQALGQRLMSALSQHLAQEGAAGAVEFCSNQAGPVAASVKEETGVDVGRTSFRTRNSDNQPREWVEPIVEARIAEPVILRDPDGNLAATHPIRVSEMCLQCHGEQSQIGEKTLARIEELYPEDSATGFAAGDLRGWFWTEEAP